MVLNGSELGSEDGSDDGSECVPANSVFWPCCINHKQLVLLILTNKQNSSHKIFQIYFTTVVMVTMCQNNVL